MLVVLLYIAITIICVLAVSVYQKSTNAICLSRRRLEGKTVIVTGGTLGMGLIIATDLAHRGAKVIIACPFEEEGVAAREQIIKETKNEQVIFKILDLASLESTRKFAADILMSEDRLDILINNAGVGVPSDHSTKDGMHFIMQINYYGAFLLTMLLLPLLKKTGTPSEPSRILVTSSVTHLMGRVDITNTNTPKHYFLKLQYYANSKIYLVYFAKELTRRLKGAHVVINAVDPGGVGTRIFDSANIVVGWTLTLLCILVLKTPWYGAQTALHAALDDEAGKVSGAYFKNCEIQKAVSRTNSEKTAEVVWEESVRLVKLMDDELDKCFQ